MGVYVVEIFQTLQFLLDQPLAMRLLPGESFRIATQEYMERLPDDDKTAFLSAPNVIEHLQEVEHNGKSLISGSLTSRAEKVLQCVQSFMDSLGIFQDRKSVV